MGITAGWIMRFGPQSFTFIYEKWIGLMTASLIMSVFQGLYCYAMSYYGEKILALGGNSGNPIYDVREAPLPCCGSWIYIGILVLHRPRA